MGTGGFAGGVRKRRLEKRYWVLRGINMRSRYCPYNYLLFINTAICVVAPLRGVQPRYELAMLGTVYGALLIKEI